MLLLHFFSSLSQHAFPYLQSRSTSPNTCSGTLSSVQELFEGKTTTVDDMIVPKFETLLQTLKLPTSALPLPLAVLCLNLFYASIFLGIVGSLLVLLNVRFGGVLLALFLLGVTPVMHNFWDYEGKESFVEMIMFMKNLSMLGACLMFIDKHKGKVKKD